LRDTVLVGFEVRARGGAKIYVVRYRIGTGRDAPMKRFTIGRHGLTWTAETARDEASRLLALVAQGNERAIREEGSGYGRRSPRLIRPIQGREVLGLDEVRSNFLAFVLPGPMRWFGSTFDRFGSDIVSRDPHDTGRIP